MVDGYNFEQLRTQILALSEAKDWETAQKEWSVIHINPADEPQTCLCGHFPIIDICTIRNRITKNIAEVGNVCVRRFLGLRSDLLFSAVKRIQRDLSKSLNAEAIVFFREQGVLTEWEYHFLQDTKKRRSLTAVQSEMRCKISRKILAAINRRGFRGPD